MRLLFLLSAAAVFLASPTVAQDRSNPSTARLAARICLDIYGGRTSAIALENGFRTARRGYVRPASGLSLTGHSDRAEVLVTGRNRTCTYDYRSNRNARAAVDAFSDGLRSANLSEGTVGGAPAFQIGGVWHKIYARSGSQNGGFRTLISLERAR